MINAKTIMLIQILNIEINKRNDDKFSCEIIARRVGQLNTLRFYVEDRVVFMEIARGLSFNFGGAVNCNIEVKLNCNGENPAMYIKSII